jgi:hypothetical protein
MGFLTFSKLGLTILLGFVSWACYLIIFRLFFHPCRHIPGPLLARISYVYAFYYDIVLGGCMAENLPKVHARYGQLNLVCCKKNSQSTKFTRNRANSSHWTRNGPCPRFQVLPTVRFLPLACTISNLHRI